MADKKDRMVIYFNGYLEIQKDDLVINEINEGTGRFNTVDPKQYTPDELIEGVRNGRFFISLDKCLKYDGGSEIKTDLEKL